MGGFAQTMGSLTGKVTDTQGEGLPGIAVMLKGSSQGVATQVNGRYTLTDIAPGRHRIIVSGVGLANQEVTVSIKAGQTAQQDFVMQEDATQMEEVVIQAESKAEVLRLSAQAVEVIETGELKLKTADLGEVMAQTQGVNVRRAGGLGSGTRFALNGLSGDQIRFFYNGVPLDFTPYSFGIANVPVNLIDRVEVYKGVVPVEFGADALGGAVNLVSPGVHEGLGGSASYQVGSFGTHRVSGNLNCLHEPTGLFVVGGGFYDYADNNYEIQVEVPDERGRISEVTVPRFHDAYRAVGGNLTVGIKDKTWADELSVQAFYGDYENEIQHNQIMSGNPYGDVRFFNTTLGLGLTYGVGLNDKVDIDLNAGYTYRERVFVDTSRCQYNWFGECIRVNNVAGEIERATDQIIWDDNYYARLSGSYQLAPDHTLQLSVAPTLTFRSGDERLINGTLPINDRGRLLNLVNGLEYTATLWGGRLENIAFVKSYQQSLKIESFVTNLNETSVDTREVSYFGGGNGIKVDLFPRLSAKLSYEYAIRMPRQDEIFGDGQLILGNNELQPERSHNANLELGFSSKPRAKSTWEVQSNFFLRQTDDLIFLVVGFDEFGSYRNVWRATSQGLELSGKWTGLNDRLTLSGNTTYQHYINRSEDGPFTAFRGDRIPNTPYYFANASAQYNLPEVFKSQDKLTLFWSARYVHSFFRSWESAGIREFKLEIPRQLLQNAGITYRVPTDRFYHAITAEVQNLTDERVFDFLGVQRPGRAFFLKVTTQF